MAMTVNVLATTAASFLDTEGLYAFQACGSTSTTPRRCRTAHGASRSTVDTVQKYVHPSCVRRAAGFFGALTQPNELGNTPPAGYSGFNGRAPQDDVMDNTLSILTNSAGHRGRNLPGGILTDFPRFRIYSGINMRGATNSSAVTNSSDIARMRCSNRKR